MAQRTFARDPKRIQLLGCTSITGDLLPPTFCFRVFLVRILGFLFLVCDINIVGPNVVFMFAFPRRKHETYPDLPTAEKKQKIVC